MSIRSVHADRIGTADKEYLAKNGCLMVKSLFTAAEIELALQQVMAALPEEGYCSPMWGFSNPIGSLASEFSQSEAEWNLYAKPQLIGVIEALTDWPHLYWYEVTGTLSIAWSNQQDGTWLHLDYDDGGNGIMHDEAVIYGMIYLTDVDELCARTKVVPGSHITVREHLLRHPNDPRNATLYDDVEFFGFDVVVPIDAEPGDVLLFDYLLAHSGGGQQRDESRPVLRVGFTNGKGNLAAKKAKVPEEIVPILSPLGRQLAGLATA